VEFRDRGKPARGSAGKVLVAKTVERESEGRNTPTSKRGKGPRFRWDVDTEIAVHAGGLKERSVAGATGKLRMRRL